MSRRHKVVAISTGDSKEDIRQFRKETGAAYDMLLDAGNAARAFGIRSSPTCILVEPGGKVTYRGQEPPESLR